MSCCEAGVSQSSSLSRFAVLSAAAAVGGFVAYMRYSKTKTQQVEAKPRTASALMANSAILKNVKSDSPDDLGGKPIPG